MLDKLDRRGWMRWAAFIALGVWLERRALILPERNSHTLSAVVRLVFRTEKSQVGRAAFLISWGALTAWFLPHILRRPKGQNLL